MSAAWCPRCGRALESALARCPEHDLPAAVPIHASDPFIGRVIDDRFTLEARIGAGGMGTVYRASQRALVRPVAVKIVDARWTQSPDTVRRFLREAHTLSRISHPSVVSVLDFGQSQDGVLWLAMELLAGRTLGEVLAETPSGMPYARAVQLGIELTWALEAAHAAGIVHRDLKPSNVMILDALTGRDFIKVLDFGIARPVLDATQMTATGKLVGTPQYLAPEVLVGEVPGPEADLYALGIILYELLTGQAPFTGNNLANVMYAQVHSKPAPLPPRVPVAIARVVEKLLVKDPTERPRSAATVRALLESARGAVVEQRQIAESNTEPTPVVSGALRAEEAESSPHDERTVATAEIGRKLGDLSRPVRAGEGGGSLGMRAAMVGRAGIAASVPAEVDISLASLVAPVPTGRAAALEGLLAKAPLLGAQRTGGPVLAGGAPSPFDFAATERASADGSGPVDVDGAPERDVTGPTRAAVAGLEATGPTRGSVAAIDADPAVLRGITAGLDLTPPAPPDAVPTVVRPEVASTTARPADALPQLVRPSAAALVTVQAVAVPPTTPISTPRPRLPWRGALVFALVALGTFAYVRWSGARERPRVEEHRAAPPPVMAVPAPSVRAMTSTVPR